MAAVKSSQGCFGAIISRVTADYFLTDYHWLTVTANAKWPSATYRNSVVYSGRVDINQKP
jgi:hypothetical protein